MSESETNNTEEKLDEVSESSEEVRADPSFEDSQHPEVVDLVTIQNSTAKYPGLQPIIELFIIEFSSQLSKFIRRKVNLKLADFKFCQFGDYCARVDNSNLFNLFTLKTFNQHVFINFPYEFLDSTITSLFGGTLNQEELVFKGIGRVGHRIIQRILNLVTTSLQTIWNDVVRFDFEFIKTYANSLLITKVHPNEAFALIRYHLEYGDVKSYVDILLAQNILDKLKSSLRIGGNKTVDRMEEQGWQQDLRQEILGVMITLAASLPQVDLTLNEVLNLKEGDIIPILDPQKVFICSDSKKLFLGIAGVSDQKCVVKIKDVYQE